MTTTTEWTCKDDETEWTCKDDEEYAAYILLGKRPAEFVGDMEMQAHMHAIKLICPGVPDATFDATEASGVQLSRLLHSDEWNIRCMQVCRAYTRRHLNRMIAEKVYKSSVWVDHIQLRKTTFTCETFIIAVFVREQLRNVAERIAGYANGLLAGTIFRVEILVPPIDIEKVMFSYIATNRDLCQKRKLPFNSAGEVVLAHELGKEYVANLLSAENEKADDSLPCLLWMTEVTDHSLSEASEPGIAVAEIVHTP